MLCPIFVWIDPALCALLTSVSGCSYSRISACGMLKLHLQATCRFLEIFCEAIRMALGRNQNWDLSDAPFRCSESEINPALYSRSTDARPIGFSSPVASSGGEFVPETVRLGCVCGLVELLCIIGVDCRMFYGKWSGLKVVIAMPHEGMTSRPDRHSLRGIFQNWLGPRRKKPVRPLPRYRSETKLRNVYQSILWRLLSNLGSLSRSSRDSHKVLNRPRLIRNSCCGPEKVWSRLRVRKTWILRESIDQWALI